MSELERRILERLRQRRNGGTGADWLRFVAREEARRSGGGAAEAEVALEELHQRGLVTLAFGYERGELSGRP